MRSFHDFNEIISGFSLMIGCSQCGFTQETVGLVATAKYTFTKLKFSPLLLKVFIKRTWTSGHLATSLHSSNTWGKDLHSEELTRIGLQMTLILFLHQKLKTIHFLFCIKTESNIQILKKYCTVQS